ncbi:hypothetical protein ACFQ14_04190 [Pseudahrensia aquimaris]|uniref:Uncharacterized protein n=1 Tax=Pseudahrensia aquimaris TaxID=744461 RepID=A0ABW3FGV2_9HYPH
MNDSDQPMEPDLTGKSSGPNAEPDMLGDIPIVDAEEIRASTRSARVADAIRCDLATAIASLSTLESARLAIVTPDDESNLGGAVALARALSVQFSTVVVDMAADARSTRDMLDCMDHPGLKDVLTGEKKVSECIFRDTRSAAHIMPSGLTQQELNPHSVQLLPVVIDALESGYQFVIIDAGGADERSLARIADDHLGVVLVTGLSASAEIDDRVLGLRRAGYDEPVIVEMIQL